MRIARTIEASIPLGEAFVYVADFEHTAEWDPGIAESRRVSGDGGVGTRYEVVALFRGRRLPFRYTVTERDDRRRIVLQGEGDKARSTDEVTFAEAGEGRTRVTYEAELAMKGIWRIAEPFLRRELEQSSDKAMAGLAARLEGGR